MRARLWAAILLALAAVPSMACGGPSVDLAKGLQLVDVSSGWFDVGIVDGQNKLVPSISFRIKNVSDQTLNVLQVNVLFRRVTEQEEWGSGFVTVAGSEGLAPGATSKLLVVKSQQGYKGTESRQDILKNHLFIDAKVDLFAKYASLQWKKIAEYPVTRKLIVQ